MLKKIFLILLFVTTGLNAQYTITGKIESNAKFTWIMLYQILDGKQVYVENTSVNDNTFTFKMNEEQTPGLYRIYYQVQQNRYVELIYNKENIRFSFNPDKPSESIVFTESDENKIYQEYYKKITVKQKKLDSLQVSYFKAKNERTGKEIVRDYKKQLEELQVIQNDFEKRSTGKMAHHFITASRQYNAKIPHKDPQAYINDVKLHFFDAIDFNDKVLVNSTLIDDKLIDYVFYLNQAESLERTNVLQKEAIEKITAKISKNYPVLKNFYENALYRYSVDGNLDMVDFTMEEFYKKLPAQFQSSLFKEKIKTTMKTAIGTKAPDFSWKENGKTKDLYSLKGHEYYIVVFFSSGCPHCQDEIPVFNEFIKDIQNIQVIAVGLEDEKAGWEKMTADYTSFINILDLDKWESKRARAYGVTAIPSFFVLDKDKNILAKPDDVKELKKIFSTTE